MSQANDPQGSGTVDPTTPSAAVPPASNVGTPARHDVSKPNGQDSDETSTAKVVAREASTVASSGVEAAKKVADEASAQVKDVAQQAKAQLTDLVGQTRAEVLQQAQARGEQAARGLRTLSDQIRALSDGRPGEAGPLMSYLDGARERVVGFAETLERRGPQGLLDDVSRFARRKPGAFLLVAATTGFAVGRLVRAGAAASHDHSDGADGSRSNFEPRYGNQSVGGGAYAALPPQSSVPTDSFGTVERSEGDW
jgi:hypothetical protein